MAMISEEINFFCTLSTSSFNLSFLKSQLKRFTCIEKCFLSMRKCEIPNTLQFLHLYITWDIYIIHILGYKYKVIHIGRFYLIWHIGLHMLGYSECEKLKKYW